MGFNTKVIIEFYKYLRLAKTSHIEINSYELRERAEESKKVIKSKFDFN